ncbi:hypothetical protein [Pedobacter deserti]|uniref:hypothetical protein n=1 Tax=Pedobacter deserti TaxID=2817382 RepID=UPI00210ACE67|nr:hypothetical protein [Pedobacter sp. SYSU D00382]
MKKKSDHDRYNAGFPGGENEEQVKRQIWTHIESATLLATPKTERKNRRLSKFSIYAAAASIALVAGIFLALQTNSHLRPVTIDNINGKYLRKVSVGNLEFILQPNSECTIEQSLISNTTSLKFCGAVSVQNVSPVARKVHVASGLFSCTVTVNDSISLHKGQTYLAMTDQRYSLISATTEEILDGLPRSFSSRLEKRFNL